MSEFSCIMFYSSCQWEVQIKDFIKLLFWLLIMNNSVTNDTNDLYDISDLLILPQNKKI